MEKTNFRLYDAMEAAAERYGMSFQEAAVMAAYPQVIYIITVDCR